jgi:hypothetical protein
LAIAICSAVLAGAIGKLAVIQTLICLCWSKNVNAIT